jgi:hypothetical protein
MPAALGGQQVAHLGARGGFSLADLARASIALRSRDGSNPSTRTVPDEGAISPAISRSSVDFPEPLRPMMPMRGSVRCSDISDRITFPATEYPAPVSLIPVSPTPAIIARQLAQ